ncbi:hypothetical protein [Streptoalloteichus hindustanus]|uniref:Uncharacterized protein n=1 Tax=Streptoalloteichus hindustanus TaxID=2017 RepID=A0A1M5L0K3_STRHI|nr:hypothetical protein [Streptoalloteichus hindustanus]SHG58299.1 hypothetical protein SAMN05444320_110118 [Streptoalloteichus hindustanus]
MVRERTALPRLAGGYGSALGFGVGVLTTTAAVAAGAAGAPLLGLTALAVAVFAVSAVTTLPGAVLTAAQCWGLHAGFVLGRAGAIAVDGPAARAAAVLLAAALLGTGLGRLWNGLAPARPAPPAPGSRFPERLPAPRTASPPGPVAAAAAPLVPDAVVPVSGEPGTGTATTPSPARS